MIEKRVQLRALETMLRRMSAAVLWKYQPIVVGVTGSVGKTSAKEAIALVLSKKYFVRQNEKNYNNEIGIPLTILGMKSAGRSLWRWAIIIFRWTFLMIFPAKYPKIIVIEMGVDHPQDMEYLLSFIHPEVGVMTNVGSSHLENFSSIEEIAKEKGLLIEKLPNTGLAILNLDDERVAAMKILAKAPVDTIGVERESHVKADNIQFNYSEDRFDGISFKLTHQGTTLPVRLRHILATHQVYAALAAVSAGLHFKMNLVEIATALEEYMSPPGRMNLIAGIKHSMIIDDSYNASPVSTVAAVQVASEIRAKRKIVVVGDMLELGNQMREGHIEVAQKISSSGISLVFAVGERMEIAVRELNRLNFPPEQVFYFDNPETAARKLQDEIREGDLILVKGSQSMRMEKVVEEIMAEPEKAEQLLCRQSKDWKAKPFVLPKMES